MFLNVEEDFYNKVERDAAFFCSNHEQWGITAAKCIDEFLSAALILLRFFRLHWEHQKSSSTPRLYYKYKDSVDELYLTYGFKIEEKREHAHSFSFKCHDLEYISTFFLSNTSGSEEVYMFFGKFIHIHSPASLPNT